MNPICLTALSSLAQDSWVLAPALAIVWGLELILSSLGGLIPVIVPGNPPAPLHKAQEKPKAEWSLTGKDIGSKQFPDKHLSPFFLFFKGLTIYFWEEPLQIHSYIEHLL